MKLKKCQHSNKCEIDNVIDQIFDVVDKACLDGKFDIVEKLLEEVDVDETCITHLLSWLTISRAAYANGEIPYYETFYEKVFCKIKEGAENTSLLLVGLDPKELRSRSGETW